MYETHLLIESCKISKVLFLLLFSYAPTLYRRRLKIFAHFAPARRALARAASRCTTKARSFIVLYPDSWSKSVLHFHFKWPLFIISCLKTRRNYASIVLLLKHTFSEYQARETFTKCYPNKNSDSWSVWWKTSGCKKSVPKMRYLKILFLTKTWPFSKNQPLVKKLINRKNECLSVLQNDRERMNQNFIWPGGRKIRFFGWHELKFPI